VNAAVLVLCLCALSAGGAFGASRGASSGGSEGGTAGSGIPPLTTVRVAMAMARPLFVTAPTGDLSRVFIVEQRGSAGVANRGDIKVLHIPAHTLNAAPFTSVFGLTTGDEQGLLGLAFHPNYMQNGYFWIYYCATGGGAAGHVVLARRHANPASDVADAGETILLTHNDDQNNHNGGWLAFGPDGYLYLALGDGGGSNDNHSSASCPNGNGQCLATIWGKMLRIDVDGPDDIPGNADDGATGYTIPPSNPFFGSTVNRQEIWAHGLRNPWRNSFDRLTGDLYIADVGQGAREEVDFQLANNHLMPGDRGYQGGRNYGWRCMEGFGCTGLSGCTCNAAGLVLPIWEYFHNGQCSITGGYVYRGCAIPALQGHYFFADFCSSQIWSFPVTGTGSPVPANSVTDRSAELDPPGNLSINAVTSFGEDALGELYICKRGNGTNGEVYKIIPVTFANDCNTNSVEDECDIAAGASQDVNENGVPDECEPPPSCPADIFPVGDGDGSVGPGDLGQLLAKWGKCPDPCPEDLAPVGEPDGIVGPADLGQLLSQWGQCGK
jgi:glucose/arabinose dehydrogenase